MPPRTGQEIRGFLGVNLRKERVSLADDELARAINADLHTQPGAILLRHGRTKQFRTALTNLVVRRLAKINGFRYQVAGRAVFRDQEDILTGLSANLITTLMPFRPLTDTTTWAFIADDAAAGMRMDNGTTTQAWGIRAPTTAIRRAIGYTGSELTGSYRGGYTGLRFDGDVVAHEGNPDTSNALTLTAQRLTLGNMEAPNDSVDGFGIYRTVAGGSTLLLDERVAIPTEHTDYSVTFTFEAAVDPGNLSLQWAILRSSTEDRSSQAWEADTTVSSDSEDVDGYRATYLWEIAAEYVTTQTKRWAWSSTTLDAALGEEVEDDNDQPPDASWVTAFQEHAFLCRDAENPHYLWYSKRFRPESWPTTQFLEIGNPDDPLQCALPLAGMLGVFSRLTKYRVVGNATSGFVAQEALSRRGTPAPMACVTTERGIIFPARDGVFVTNLLAADDELSEAIAPIFWGESVNDIAAINWDAASTISAAMWKGRYYLSLPTGDATSPDVLAVYSTTTRRWYFYDHPCRSLFAEEDTDTLLAGFTDGYVYVLENADAEGDDDGDDIALIAETKDYVGGSSATRKLFQYVRVDMETSGEDVAVDMYVDGVLKRTATLSSSRGRELISFPGGALGYAWRLRFRYTGTTRVRIYGAACIYQPLETH